MLNRQYFTEQLQETSPQSIFYTDDTDRIFYMNPPAVQSLGIESGRELGELRIGDLAISEPFKQVFHDARNAAESQGGVFFGEIRAGEVEDRIYVHIRCSAIHDPQKKLIGYAYVYLIDDRAENQAFDKVVFDNLMKNSEDLIFFKDRNSRFRHCSDSLVRRIGVDSMSDLIGKTDFDFWDAEYAQKFFEDDQRTMSTQTPMPAKAEVLECEDGQQKWLLTSKMPLIDEDGEVIGVFGISKDITEQKEIEAEVEQLNKDLVSASRRAGMAEIATNVLHNVGNVLNSINVSVSQIDELSRQLSARNVKKIAGLLADNADVTGYLTTDEKGSRIPRYLDLMADEIDLGRQQIDSELQSTKRHLEHIKMIVAMQQEYATANSIVEEVDLKTVVDDALQMSSGSLERHQIQLDCSVQPGTTVLIDKHRVLQILVNLIRNAKHALEETEQTEKRIAITANTDDAQAFQIKVADNGVGIDPKNLVKLFTHGFTTKKDGHGFGLHSGANAAKEMGGSLAVHSDGKGQGATFTLTLPIAPGAEKTKQVTTNLIPSSLGGSPVPDSPVVSG